MIYKRGKHGTYWYRFRFAGRMIHESTRTQSKTLAPEAERQRRRELETKWNHVERRTLPRLLSAASSAWLAVEKPHLAKRTHEIYEVAVRCHLVPALGPLLLWDIGADAIASYQARRKGADASARTINKELQVLRQILKRHKPWAYVHDDQEDDLRHMFACIIGMRGFDPRHPYQTFHFARNE